jgi:hypothetical protein
VASDELQDDVNESPVWVIPAITASASLLGTVVGGLVAYWTSKRMHERTTAVEELRQRHQLLREGSTRFISTMSEISVSADGLGRITEKWGPKAAALAAARSDDEVVEAARAISPDIETGGGRVAIVMRLLRESGVLDEDINAATAVLSELRLVAPGDVADSAQRVLYKAFARELTAAFAPHLNRRATGAYNAEVNEFFNRVRHHLSVENIEFDFINEDVAQDVLDLERDTKS